MMRGVNGGGDSTRPGNTNTNYNHNHNHNHSNALDTINAAATALVSAERNRGPQDTVQKRRWGGCWAAYFCFGYHRHRRHAVVIPENSVPRTDAPSTENVNQLSTIVLPFIAPPSSPASFLQSEPPSATQSPAGIFSLTSMSASMYSPGPSNIFAIGPYANETQLVSPPVFSTFTTEPSTAPFTPPPESVQLTTPSSPEVPFARLLDPGPQSGEAGQRFLFSNYEFPSYQLYPGSPVGHLISPSSGISGSGTSSPFPDGEYTPGGPHFLQFQMGEPPKLLNLDKLSTKDWGSRRSSGTLTPDSVRPSTHGLILDCAHADVAAQPHSDDRLRNDQVVDHRVSFELAAEDVLRCMEQKPALSVKTVPGSLADETIDEKEEISDEVVHSSDCHVGEISNNQPDIAPTDGKEASGHQKHQSIALGSVKEFNFDNADGRDSHGPTIGPDWWANGIVAGKETGATENWSFFPMIQPGVS